MALVTIKELMTPLPKGWAVGAFNINDLDDVKAIIQAAEEKRSPVILQVSEGVAKHVGVELVANICCTAAKAASVPVAVHLDHCHSMELAIECMRYGFSSVMIDGSKLPFEENVALTKKVVEVARYFNVSVEAELGLVGGKEDDLVNDDSVLTKPSEAKRFVEETGVDVFSPAIGTIHGLYKGEPKLDIARLKEIASLIDMPIALHGGSGLTPQQFQDCMDNGVTKINVGTDLKYAAVSAMRDYVLAHPEEVEPRNISTAIRNSVAKVTMEKLSWFGSTGKAN